MDSLEARESVIYTDRQLAIMEFLQQYRREHRNCPTMEEMAAHFNVVRVTIHEHIRKLESKGAIQRTPHLSRSIEIIDPQFLDTPAAQQPGYDGGDRLRVPLLGNIAAGEKIEVIENSEQLDLADLLPMGKDHYALKVQGTSMIDEGIHDGDLVIVERRDHADDGDLVVAILEGEIEETTTLKKMYRENRDGQDVIRLQPANETFEPIIVDQVEIRGVVVGVVRRYPSF
jgi:repressor LexA